MTLFHPKLFAAATCGVYLLSPLSMPAAFALFEEKAQATVQATIDKTSAPEQVTQENAAQELEVLEFVQSNQKNLYEVLTELKETDSSKYESALQDVHKVIRRLRGIEKKSSKLYQADLEAWVIQSEIDLLVAKSSAGDEKVSKGELKKLVQRRIANQLARLEAEKEMLESRSKQIAETLEQLRENEDARIDQQVNAIFRRINNAKNRSRPQSK